MKICLVCTAECGPAGVFRGQDEPCCSANCARVAYEELGPYDLNDDEEKAREQRNLNPLGLFFFCVVCGTAINRFPHRDEADPCCSPECAQAVYAKEGPSKHSKDMVKPAHQVILPEDVAALRANQEKLAKPSRRRSSKASDDDDKKD